MLRVLMLHQHVAVLDKQLTVPKCPQTGSALDPYLTLGDMTQVLQPQTGSNACLKCSYWEAKEFLLEGLGAVPAMAHAWNGR